MAISLPLFLPSFLPLSGKGDTTAFYSLREIPWNIYSTHSSSSDGNGFRTWIDIRRFGTLLAQSNPIQSNPPFRARARGSAHDSPSVPPPLSSSPPLLPSHQPVSQKQNQNTPSRLASFRQKLRKPAALQTRPPFFLCFSMLFFSVLSRERRKHNPSPVSNWFLRREQWDDVFFVGGWGGGLGEVRKVR